MPQYLPTAPPAGLDLDGLRKWTEEEFRRVAQSLALNPIVPPTTALSASGGTIPTFNTGPTSYYTVVGGRLAFVNLTAVNTSGGTPGSGAQQVLVSLPWPVRANALTSRVLVGVYTNSAIDGTLYGQFVAGATTMPLYKNVVSGTRVDQVPFTLNDLNAADRAISLRYYYGVDA